jgi:hypothetical protein
MAARKAAAGSLAAGDDDEDERACRQEGARFPRDEGRGTTVKRHRGARTGP